MGTLDRVRSPRRRSPRRRNVIEVVAILVAAALALTGCDTEPDDGPRTSGLLVMSGDVGAVDLTIRDGASPDGRSLALPDPATTWISAGRANVLMATLLDGRTFVSGPYVEGRDPAWRPVEAVGVDGEPLEGPAYFGTWDPPGGAYALLASDFSEGGGLRVVVVDPALEGASEATFPGLTALAAPPAWIDDDRVAVVVATAGGPAVRIVDTASAVSTDGPDEVAIVATSADTRMAAVWRGSGPVEVLSTEAWLDGERGTIRLDPPGGASRPGVIALDGTGSRLAIVWLDAADAPMGIAVHVGERNWERTTTIDVGSVGAASVAWLR